MYGLINTAIRDLVTSEFGEAAWNTIAAKAGVNEPSFVTMTKYPDEMTYRLVGAASETLGVPAEAVLEKFGKYWVAYSAQTAYGHLMDFAGSNLVEFLQNLDAMHTRIALSFPKLEPPSFWVSDVTPDGLRLHYRSSRPGLAPLVVGMTKGVAERFGTPVEVQLDRPRGPGHDDDEFVVRYVHARAAVAA